MPDIHTQDERFMLRALELAKSGAGLVSPNPLVGCVIVRERKIVAEGYHKKYGGPHAEIEALKKIKNHPPRRTKIKMDRVTVYVNHEPCVLFEGKKTPSCAEALIAAGVKRVVVGMKDPNPKVAGRGIKKLRAAGIQVDAGVLERECKELNEVFTHWVKTKKPFVVLKVATTLDGALTFTKGTRSNFSSPESYRLVHRLRQQYDAIALGVNSVVIDDPLLTTRGISHARNPMRVIFDTHLRIPPRAKLLSQSGQTIVFTGEKITTKKRAQLLRAFNNLTIVQTPPKRGGKGERVEASFALDWLGKSGITSVLVEGGAHVAHSFLQENLVDKFMLAITPNVSADSRAPRLFFENNFSLQFVRHRWEVRGIDTWFIGYPKHNA